MNEFLPFLFNENGFNKGLFKVILTQDECHTIPRKGYGGFGNPYVYLKALTKVWEIWMGGYDARNTMIVDDSKETHVFIDEGNYIITKG